jgi:hypothetical protein
VSLFSSSAPPPPLHPHSAACRHCHRAVCSQATGATTFVLLPRTRSTHSRRSISPGVTRRRYLLPHRVERRWSHPHRGQPPPPLLHFNRSRRRDRGELWKLPVPSILPLPSLLVVAPCVLATVVAMASVGHTA